MLSRIKMGLIKGLFGDIMGLSYEKESTEGSRCSKFSIHFYDVCLVIGFFVAEGLGNFELEIAGAIFLN